MPIPPVGTDSEVLANRLFKDLVGEINAHLPEINLFDAEHTIPWDADSEIFKPVEKVKIEELVGYFDDLMKGFKTHLEGEYEKGRITGSEYSRTYIALSQMAMQSAVQFALGKDQSFWMAAKTQADAITAHNQNEVVKLEAMLRRASYALTKLKLATEDSAFGVSNLNLEEAVPAQIELTKEQKLMVHEQMEAQRAQTLDNRQDGTNRLHPAETDPYMPTLPRQGLLGIQKALYTQQINSYQEDAKVKAARVFSDLWITQKTVDGADTPNAADKTSVNDVLNKLRDSLGLSGV